MEFEASTDMHFGNTVKLHLDGLSFVSSFCNSSGRQLILDSEVLSKANLQLAPRAYNSSLYCGQAANQSCTSLQALSGLSSIYWKDVLVAF